MAAIAEQVEQGETPEETVRELLSWFYAERRGYLIVREIRNALRKHKLRTTPDFEATYIDARVRFVSSVVTDQPSDPESPPISPIEGTPEIAGTTTERPQVDPTQRISRLASANTPPLYVGPDAPLGEDVTQMLMNDYSQLPVMLNERVVIGLISWQTIATKLALGLPCSTARECMGQVRVLAADASILEAITELGPQGAILVRGDAQKITGILTSTDFNDQFRQLAEPFVLLGEIENHLRVRIDEAFTTEEIQSAKNPDDTNRTVEQAADLTLGECARLLEKPNNWNKLDTDLHRKTFVKQLAEIVGVRNDVMHFDPDGIASEQLDRLRKFSRLLQIAWGNGQSPAIE
ncbi:MAG: CBS domain-containing protein [Dehalococcoidia bacterium]|nr:CBS domain-containing protein [Dehalococcoidia bacterium]